MEDLFNGKLNYNIDIITLQKLYEIHKTMNIFPDLQSFFREHFYNVLLNSNIIDKVLFQKEIDKNIEIISQKEKYDPLIEDNSNIHKRISTSVKNNLIDLYFAKHFSKEQVENNLILVRKREGIKTLLDIVNRNDIDLESIRQKLYEFCLIPQGEQRLSKAEVENVRVALIKRFISNQLPFIGVAKNHITIRDINEIVNNRTIHIHNNYSEGMFGGKSAGMFLAYRILMNASEEIDEDLKERIEIPDSFYVSSDVFDELLRFNGLDKFFHQKYKTLEEIDREYPVIYNDIMEMKFPEEIVIQVKRLLEDKLNDSPLIVRSSSHLEDSFGAAFSGKYESYFISNVGSLKERLNEFLKAVKMVYASAFAPDPIMYRLRHNLLDYSEHMSILVQKVVGRKHDKYFYPCVGGVGFSRNMHKWSSLIKKEDGLLRFVFGLGTRAVDRIGHDYPRMVSLTNPKLRPETEIYQIRKYSQQLVDVIDLEKKEFTTISKKEALKKDEDQHPELHKAVSFIEDGYLITPVIEMIDFPSEKLLITFDKLINNTSFANDMKRILKTLEKYYHCPVDIEYAYDDGKIYLLQCRPLAQRKEVKTDIKIPAHIEKEDIIFSMNRNLTNIDHDKIEYIVYVVPGKYNSLPTHTDKNHISRIVGCVNNNLQGKNFIMMGPGRWGSSDINLGVKVRYVDINNCKFLVEIAKSQGGYTPEFSFGSHFFQDLVEADIIPLPLYPEEKGIIFKEDFFMKSENTLMKYITSNYERYEDCVKVIHIPSNTDGKYLRIIMDEDKQKGLGYLN